MELIQKDISQDLEKKWHNVNSKLHRAYMKIKNIVQVKCMFGKY